MVTRRKIYKSQIFENNMEMKKKALLGFHNYQNLYQYARKLDEQGYSVVKTESIKKMLEQARKDEYSLYLMDVNLGVPAGEDITPSRQMYELVKQRVESGEAIFLAVSHSWEPLARAINEGILVMEKKDLSDFLSKL